MRHIQSMRFLRPTWPIQPTMLFEWLIIAGWAIWFAFPYLTLDPTLIPNGNPDANEWLALIPSNHFWTRVKTCGWCSLWNGAVQGGLPALSDPYTSMLHPVMAIPTLLFGVRTGASIALVGAFLMAGLAQWWLASELGAGSLTRVWSGGMAVVAGHLAPRMELGFYGLVIAGAACALVLPPLIAVSRTGNRRMAVVLGITLALAAVAGQGYLQLGLLLTLPAVILLLPLPTTPNARRRWMAVGRAMGIAAVVALLLAAPLLIPVFHFLPQFTKLSDPGLRSGQPFPYVFFNLFIANESFYYNPIFGKEPYAFPAIYTQYIGWIPLVLAALGAKPTSPPSPMQPMREQDPSQSHQSYQACQTTGSPRPVYLARPARPARPAHLIWFLIAIAIIPLWVASNSFFPMIAAIAPPSIAEQVSQLRYYPTIAGLALPPLIALTGFGIERLSAAIRPLRARTEGNLGGNLLYGVASLALVIALAGALMSAWSFNRRWIAVRPIPDSVFRLLEEMKPDETQWISFPGEQRSPYIEPAIAMGMKVTDIYQSFAWKDHPPPPPMIAIQPVDVDPRMKLEWFVESFLYYTGPPVWNYAIVAHPIPESKKEGKIEQEITVCRAEAYGGAIDVMCDVPREGELGELIVKEHWWKGWQATLDGEPIPLREGTTWLSVEVPAGEHTIRFRYRPWDVPLGLVLCGVGVAVAVWVCRRGNGQSRAGGEQ